MCYERGSLVAMNPQRIISADALRPMECFSEKALMNTLYAICLAPNKRQTKLATSY